jgi:hypothetical protein
MSDSDILVARITDYLVNGGLFNPEHSEHSKVSDLLIDCRSALAAAPQHEQQSALLITPCKHEIVDCRACKGTFVNAIHLAQPEQQERPLQQEISDTFGRIWSAIVPRVYGVVERVLVLAMQWEEAAELLDGSRRGLSPTDDIGVTRKVDELRYRAEQLRAAMSQPPEGDAK